MQTENVASWLKSYWTLVWGTWRRNSDYQSRGPAAVPRVRRFCYESNAAEIVDYNDYNVQRLIFFKKRNKL